MTSPGNSKQSDKRVVDIVDPDTHTLAGNLRRLQESIRVMSRKGGPIDIAKDLFNEAMDRLASEYDPSEYGFRLCISHDLPRELVLQVSNAGVPRIDRELLLEQGVKPSVIDRATKRTPSVYWKLEESPAEEPPAP